MKSICIAAVAFLFFAFTINDKLTGTWQGKSSIGNFRLVFTPDHTFEVLVNDKPRVSGVFTLTDSIFTMEDFACPNVIGRYKLQFFANDDSCRFLLIEDGCDDRASSADGAVVARVK